MLRRGALQHVPERQAGFNENLRGVHPRRISHRRHGDGPTGIRQLNTGPDPHKVDGALWQAIPDGTGQGTGAPA